MELTKTGIDEMKKLVSQKIQELGGNPSIQNQSDREFSKLKNAFDIPENEIGLDPLSFDENSFFNMFSTENWEKMLPSLDSLEKMLPASGELFKLK